MSDLISRQAAQNAIRKRMAMFRDADCEWAMNAYNGACECLGEIKRLPSVKQEIIKCKDCKHRYVGGNGMTHYFACDFMDAQYDDEGFCSHAERKDNG